MDNPVYRVELDEIIKRLDAENERQNHRLNALEETVNQIHSLATSVEKLALGVQNTVDELKKHSARLETLESRDGEMWRKVIGYILTAIASTAATIFFSQFC